MLKKSFGKRHLALFFVALSLFLLLTGCGAKSSYQEKSTSDLMEPSDYDAKEDSGSGYNYADIKQKTETGENAGAFDGRKKIFEKTMNFETKEFDTFFASLKQQIAENSGYVEQSSITGSRGENSMRYATIKLRIPSERINGFLKKVSKLATVVSEQELTKDVTLEYIDVESRIKALQVERDTLLRLMEEAASLENLLTVQTRLTEVRASLEASETKRRTLDDLVAYSTVTMNIDEVERITPVKPKNAWQQIEVSFKENLYQIGTGFRAFFIWFVGNLPNIVLFLVVFLLAVVFIRIGVKKLNRRAEKAYGSRSKDAAKSDETSKSPYDEKNTK